MTGLNCCPAPPPVVHDNKYQSFPLQTIDQICLTIFHPISIAGAKRAKDRDFTLSPFQSDHSDNSLIHLLFLVWGMLTRANESQAYGTVQASSQRQKCAIKQKMSGKNQGSLRSIKNFFYITL